MQELIAELIEAVKAMRVLEAATTELHVRYEEKNRERELAFRRVSEIRRRLDAEVRAAAGYTPEEIEEISKLTA